MVHGGKGRRKTQKRPRIGRNSLNRTNDQKQIGSWVKQKKEEDSKTPWKRKNVKDK